MGVDSSLVGMLDDARASHRQLSATALEDLGDIQGQRREITATPIERPEVPDLPETPEPPPTTMPSSGRRVYGQFLPVLAMLGGALVRRDATAALRTGAAAMRAARANDVQNLELQHQHWEDQVTRITSDRQAMLDQYQSALSDANLDLNSRLAILGALASQENNIEMRTRVSMGDLQGIAESINTQMRAVEALRTQIRQDSQANEQERHNRAMENRAGGGGQLAGAEQRGRIVMSLPNVLAGLTAMTEIEERLGYNPYSDNEAAYWTGRIPGANPIEQNMTGDNPDYQAYNQAASTLEQSFVPMFAGAATTESEARRYVRANSPVLGDTIETLRSKRQNLQRLANQAAVIINQPPPYPQAGSLDPRQAALLTPPAAAPTTPAGAGAPGEINIPQEAIQFLRDNPETAAQFESTFGLEPGTAQFYMGE